MSLKKVSMKRSSRRSLGSWACGLAFLAASLTIAGSAGPGDSPRGAAEKAPAPVTAPGEAAKAPPKPATVGPQACRTCHPEEYKVWVGSKHARAFVSLQTPAARQVSAEPKAYAGMPTQKMMSQCSSCHAVGMSIPRRERERSFHPEDGVHCEACHGPGGHYANAETMKDPARRAQAGLVEPGKDGCLSCHMEKPSHAVLGKPAFEFVRAWTKIAHGPKAKETASKK